MVTNFFESFFAFETRVEFSDSCGIMFKSSSEAYKRGSSIDLFVSATFFVFVLRQSLLFY